MNDIQGRDVVLRLMLAINGVEVRRRMVVPVHANQDPEEFTERRLRYFKGLPRRMPYPDGCRDPSQRGPAELKRRLKWRRVRMVENPG